MTTTENAAATGHADNCACGHPKGRHAGPTHRGTCYPCYGEADQSPGGARPGAYCGRFSRAIAPATPGSAR